MSNNPVTLTEKAIKEIKKIMEEQGFTAENYCLEASVLGGGCSGFQYKLGFKEKADVDKLNETVIAFGDIEVAINNRAMLYLEGTTIDFHDGIDKRGFLFDNPNAKTTCGCGSSFSA